SRSAHGWITLGEDADVERSRGLDEQRTARMDARLLCALRRGFEPRDELGDALGGRLEVDDLLARARRSARRLDRRRGARLHVLGDVPIGVAREAPPRALLHPRLVALEGVHPFLRPGRERRLQLVELALTDEIPHRWGAGQNLTLRNPDAQ